MRLISGLALVATLLAAPVAAERLPRTVVPEHYDLAFTIDLAREQFSGQETIRVNVVQPTSRIILHALDLTLQDVTVASAGISQRAMVIFDRTNETAAFELPQRLASGPAEIRLRFSGTLNERLRGLYLSKTPKRKYAVTQLESTDARRAFPCFDEPSLKATFAVTATVDRGDTVISNGRALSDIPGPARTQHTITFATSPKMSSYLVALAVGDFQCLEDTEDRVPVRVCATPDKIALARVPLDWAKKILKFYNAYYSIKYPFGKLDLVAIPDFAAGAMENTAAIFFRETALLADPQTTSLSAQKNIADTIAHEMAHQWFGDLVTMAWWNDLWLNEGFATWMAAHPVAAAKPDWRIDVDEAAATLQALTLDSLATTHPVHADVETSAEIEGAFDTITYEKGAAVLRMVEHYVGADTFQRAINKYLQAHQYGNATSEDFWTAVASESKRPVDRIIPAFIEQPGVPLVEVVSVSCDAARTETTATFRQSRFVLDGAQPPRDDRIWQIPIEYTVNASRTPASPPGSFLLGTRMQTEMIAHGCAPWVFANVGAQGYYRTAYPRDMLRALAPDVLTALMPSERLSLVEDEWALVRAARHGVADYLTIAAGFGRDQVSGVLAEVISRFAFINQSLTTEASRPAFHAFVRAQLRPTFEALGVDAATGETDDRRALRGIVASALGMVDDGEVVAKARSAVDRALGGGRPLDSTAATALVVVAAAHGDGKLYDALVAAADRTTLPEEHNRYINALTSFRDAALIDRALLETRGRVRRQDTALYLARFFDNPAARDRAWRFVRDSWNDLEPRIRIAFGEQRIVGAVGAFCDREKRDEVASFFAAHPLPSAGRRLNESLERIDHCMAMKERETPLVAQWLTAR